MVGAVDRAIREAPLGLNPIMDGQTLRIPIPPLSEERRKDLQKLAGQFAESARVAVRNVRRDGMDLLKRLEKAGRAERGPGQGPLERRPEDHRQARRR